jgi:glycosyltransferase involved in cell wall biosynthesis
MGRIHPIKGAERLLNAFLGVADRCPRAFLVMAGPDEWGLEQRMRNAAHGAGCWDRVRFAGMLTGDAKLDLLARADLFCLPSDAEGFSIAVLEALASSTAVLLSPGCHFPEVERAGCGRVVPAEPGCLGEAILDFLRDPERLRAMGRTGRTFVQTNYSWPRITDVMVEEYARGIERLAGKC